MFVEETETESETMLVTPIFRNLIEVDPTKKKAHFRNRTIVYYS